jgi:hypothetical protein
VVVFVVDEVTRKITEVVTVPRQIIEVVTTKHGRKGHGRHANNPNALYKYVY